MASLSFGDPKAPSPCEQCGYANEGTMRCSVQDSKNLCQDCFEGLPQAKREDIGDPEWVCHIHLNRKVDNFCETCQLGCCKECAVDVHKGHNVKNVFKLAEEIRHDLTEQLKEVGVRADGLSELRRKIESCLGKIEVPKLVDTVIDNIKDEIAHNLENEILRIQWETQQNIIHEERTRDDKLKLAKEKGDLDIQRIQEIQHCISTGLLEDAASRREKITEAGSKLRVGQQACESANLQIKSVLESIPEKLVCQGRQLCSLVKASLAFQCQNDVLDSCRDVESDLPRPFSPFVMIVHYICLVVLCFANKARRGNMYNRFPSFESIKRLIRLCSYYPMYNAKKSLVLTSLILGSIYDYPITRIKVFMKKLKSCFRNWNTATRDFCNQLMVAALHPEFGHVAGRFLFFVASTLYLFRVYLVNLVSVSIFSIFQPLRSESLLVPPDVILWQARFQDFLGGGAQI